MKQKKGQSVISKHARWVDNETETRPKWLSAFQEKKERKCQTYTG